MFNKKKKRIEELERENAEYKKLFSCIEKTIELQSKEYLESPNYKKNESFWNREWTRTYMRILNEIKNFYKK